ncbi:MAG: acyltransferase family protein [Muribaculaceae bacterium]|nr:acyltransferase family protein [Muribaculaceae bacterium]
MKERNISIDFLKCIAALLITNSHMGILYGEYSFLATGGGIGDALFFFCSGFALLIKPMDGFRQFPNWYKRRINRIYPTMFAVAIIGGLFFKTHWDIIDIILAKRYWFIPCIMLYYIVIFFVGSYFKDKILPIGILVAISTAVWFYFVCNIPGFSIYGGHYIRWLLFFMFMLLGAQTCLMSKDIKSKPIIDICLLFMSLICFFVSFIVGLRFNGFVYVQYLSFIPLLCVTFFFYKVGASHCVERLYKSKVGNFFIRFVGSLCLEIYVVQYFFITDKMNSLFPLNIIITFIIILIAAYLTRCLARFISQTFKSAPYDWSKIIALY